jgi:hypothetical protein
VDGRLACVGSAADLKRTYGNGYQIEVRTALATEAAAAGVLALLRGVASEASLVESNNGHLRIVAEGVTALGAVFRALEGGRERLRVVDYAVSETSLEQVFLALGGPRKQQQSAAVLG